MPLWILAFLGLYLAVAFLLHRFVAAKPIREIRRELLEEALPSAMTGSRGGEESSRPFRWVDVVNLPAGEGWIASERDSERRGVPVGTVE